MSRGSRAQRSSKRAGSRAPRILSDGDDDENDDEDEDEDEDDDGGGDNDDDDDAHFANA